MGFVKCVECGEGAKKRVASGNCGSMGMHVNGFGCAHVPSPHNPTCPDGAEHRCKPGEHARLAVSVDNEKHTRETCEVGRVRESVCERKGVCVWESYSQGNKK